MKKLSRDQLTHVAHHIQRNKSHRALEAELLDHVATQIEQLMAEGQGFPAAFDQVTQLASPQAMSQLKQMYNQEFRVRPLLARASTSVRHRRRTDARPFRYMLFSSVLTFLILMVFLAVVSRPFAVPIGAFQLVGTVGVGGLATVVAVWLWLAPPRRKAKRFLLA